ncbi:MAG: hypothetical protein E7A68_19460 [Phocaeicola vulgatus]|jgi:hypothetical protein|nr:hypothetical protein [Phocaeicola vulgatus]
MAVTDRYTSYRKRKEAAGIVNPEEEQRIRDEVTAKQAEETAREQLPLRPTVAIQKPMSSVATANTIQERENADKLPEQLPGTETPWQEMSAQEAYAAHPQLSPAAYLSGVASYRKQKGQEGLSYTELAEALRGRDPLQSEEDRIKAERRLHAAENINAVGSVLANLVNVVRTRRGNPSMNLSGAGREGQARIDRIRQYGDNLARQNYQDYIGAIARDRAEQARIDVEQARQDRWKAQQAAAEREYNWNTYKFETEQAAKAAESRRKAEENAAKQAEVERHNKVTEGISLMRIDNDSQKKDGKNKYPSYRISGKKGFSGSTRAYDLNKNEDVALMYNDLEKTFGLDPDERPRSIKGMRDYILSIYGKQQKVKSGEAFNSSSQPENESWSLNENNSWSLK